MDGAGRDSAAHLIQVDQHRAGECENHSSSLLSLLVWFSSSGQAAAASISAATSPATSGGAVDRRTRSAIFGF
jgi:hypothetical protein